MLLKDAIKTANNLDNLTYPLDYLMAVRRTLDDAMAALKGSDFEYEIAVYLRNVEKAISEK